MTGAKAGTKRLSSSRDEFRLGEVGAAADQSGERATYRRPVRSHEDVQTGGGEKPSLPGRPENISPCTTWPGDRTFRNRGRIASVPDSRAWLLDPTCPPYATWLTYAREPPKLRTTQLPQGRSEGPRSRRSRAGGGTSKPVSRGRASHIMRRKTRGGPFTLRLARRAADHLRLFERLRPSLCRGVGYVHSERFDSPEKEPSARSRPDSAKFAAIVAEIRKIAGQNSAARICGAIAVISDSLAAARENGRTRN